MRVILLIICALSTILSLEAQELDFDKSTWDFGSIEEKDGKVSYRFTFKNSGKKSLVIYNIKSSCGCTTSEFSTEPIIAGDTSSIVVVYDPTNRPGAFMRDLYVYSTASKEPDVLRITGRVESQNLTIEQRYPYTIGDELRISATNPSVGVIERGIMASSNLRLINVGADTLSVDLRKRHNNDLLYVDFGVSLSPAASTELEVGYLVGASDKVLTGSDGRVSDTLDIFINGKDSGRWLCISGIVAK